MQYRNSHSKTAAVRAAPRTVTLLDPQYRCGLLEIPLDKTMPTKGRDEWLEGRLDKDLSLCCLFQKGRCHAQERCFQVHVDKDFMVALREQQSRIVSCCRKCNDTASLSSQAMTFFSCNIPSNTTIQVTYSNGGVRSIENSRIAFSAGLIQQFEEHGARVEQGILVIPARRICRLHLRGCCKYGKDCKNVHACSKLGEAFLDAPAPAAPAAAACPVNVAAGAAALPAPQPRLATPSTAIVHPVKPVDAVVVPTSKASPPMTVFAPLAATAKVEATTNPLTGFGILDRNAASGSLKSMDAAEFCESSLKMIKSFFFDANAALDDSARGSSVGGGSSDAASLMAASSPGQKRRDSAHAVHLDMMHPCSQAPASCMTACRVSNWDQWSVVSLFA